MFAERRYCATNVTSRPRAMRLFIHALLLSSVAQCKFLKPPRADQINIGDNRAKVVKIFEKVSTLNILVKNYKQPEGVATFVEDIFDIGLQTFVIFNFFDDEDYEEWLDQCINFRNTSVRTQYHERFYRKTHDVDGKKTSLDAIEDFEFESTVKHETESDPQAAVSPTHIGLLESFADDLDRWFTYRRGGYIVICTFDWFDVYLGCLVNRGGTFLFIIDGQVDTEVNLTDVTVILKKAWKTTTNLKIFVLIFNEIYVLNPFGFDQKCESYGKLEQLSDDCEIEQEFKNLNGFPMNVEIFHSAYSIPSMNTSTDEFNGKLDSFIGPDVKVARFVEKQLNVSSN